MQTPQDEGGVQTEEKNRKKGGGDHPIYKVKGQGLRLGPTLRSAHHSWSAFASLINFAVWGSLDSAS